jgi:diacylglycerol kinase family enzyme
VKIALIQNPDSGSGAAEGVAALLAAAGAEVETFAVDEADRAGRSGAERIAVAGGDGSIGCAAAAAAAAGLPLAVIATGTANDFAAHFELPDDTEEACGLAAAGTRTRRVDLARICGRPFVNVAGAGLPPAAAEEAGDLKDRLGALAYPAGAVGAAVSADPIRVAVEVDGEQVFDGEAWQVSVASSGAFGGGASFDADPADGELDAVVIEGGSRARLVKHAFGLRIGQVEAQAGVVSARGAEIVMRLDPGESLNVDGELVAAGGLDAAGRLTFASDRGGFELLVR